MAKILTVANLKGGVGKTTLAVNLAGQLSGPRSSVAVVDADAQGSASHWLGHGNVDVDLLVMPLESARGARRWIERVLAIDTEFTVIDCPPHLQAVTEAAIGIADMVVVPVTASGADLIATAKALELVRKARAKRSNGAPKCVLVPSKIDFRTSAGREIGAALKQLGEPVGPAIRQRTAFVDSFTAGQWIGDYAGRGPAAKEIAALVKFIRGRLRR
ncbi:MAG: AAA family ATPase [Alphaproteobacteria bacterium]